MNDGRGSAEFIPGYYTGKKDFSDVKKLIDQASAKARTAEEQGSHDPFTKNHRTDETASLGRAAAASDLSTSPFVAQQSAEKENLTELQRTIREIKDIGLKLQQCRSEALGRGVDGNV